MYRISMWYRGLSKGWRISVLVAASCLAVVAAGAIIYFSLLAPRKVEVREGTIVRDPVDGHVWEDNTTTFRVDEKDADNYHVKYIDVLSEEHAAMKAAEDAAKAAEAQRLAQSSGYEAISGVMTEADLANLQILQNNLRVMGNDLLTGLDMVNQLNESKNLLVSYRNQIAAMELDARFSAMQQRALSIFDLYIAAIDNYLNYIAYMHPAYLDLAQQQLDQANAAWQNLVP